MTLEQYANLFNLMAIGIVWALSLLVLARHPASYFKAWVTAYGLAFALLASELGSQSLKRPLYLASLEIALAVGGAWFFLQAGRLLTGRPPMRTAWFLAALPVVEGVCMAALLKGVAFAAVAAMPLIAMSAVVTGLGVAMVRAAHSEATMLRWVGYPLILNGLWPLSYPLLAPTQHSWVGFFVSGAMHVFTGTAMVIELEERMAAALRAKNQQLLVVDQERRNFFSTVSHELRTPLTSFVGYLELLEDRIGGPLTPQQEQYVAQMNEAASQLRVLIDSLLDSARIDSGTIEVRKEPVSVPATIEQAVGPLAPVLEKKDLTLTIDVAQDLPLAQADANRVVQVLNNLLANASKFTPAGGRIHVSASPEGDFIRVTVADTGVGISEDHLGRIFEAFYQVDSSLTRIYPGAGLGLSIVRRLVQLMGGTVSVESQVGEGSTFSFTLPRGPKRGTGSVRLPTTA